MNPLEQYHFDEHKKLHAKLAEQLDRVMNEKPGPIRFFIMGEETTMDRDRVAILLLEGMRDQTQFMDKIELKK